ncbi:MAG TPA: adhesin [Pseudomonas sp.]|uniref:adhesin n=1 Tax=Pseudomonas sp. TaxID=306 RepID=UPI002B7323C2|nr:adhesin [Pseudomonas sp.]HTO20588.1 adhesin [Pseudomonas sp.]
MIRWTPLLALLVTFRALAVDPAMHSQSVIEDTGIDSQGLVSVNAGAGELHQQINARAIAIGTELATARLQLRQELELQALDLNQDAQVNLLGESFGRSSGLTGVNQAAGSGNQQINSFRLSLGRQRQDLDDSVLAQQLVAPAQPSGATEQPKGSRIVVTDDKAFAGSRGVVQLNQSAGVGNLSVNSLSMTVVD